MLIQVGPFPPPIGGVSIHLARLKEHLDQRELANRIWSLSASQNPARGVTSTTLRRVPWKLMLRLPGTVVHYHVSGFPAKERLARFHRTMLAGHRSIFTLHGDALPIFQSASPEHVAHVLSAFDAVVCVKEGDSEFLRSQGVTTQLHDICPFLPPTERESGRPLPEVEAFLARHERVICANGASIVMRDGHELYGLDLCVELLGRLRDMPELGLVFYLAKTNDEDYLNRIRRRAQELGVTERLWLNTAPGPFFPVIQRSTLLLRPTNSDGDALSIREALHAGVPVVTSDVVRRPAGCRLFENRSLDSLEEQVRMTLGNLEGERSRLRNLPEASGLESLLALYRSMGVRKA
jgi:glycosyltransferase involved in cell wall biosynthesis